MAVKWGSGCLCQSCSHQGDHANCDDIVIHGLSLYIYIYIVSWTCIGAFCSLNFFSLSCLTSRWLWCHFLTMSYVIKMVWSGILLWTDALCHFGILFSVNLVHLLSECTITLNVKLQQMAWYQERPCWLCSSECWLWSIWLLLVFDMFTTGLV